MALLIALFVGATSGGLISAILLKIPGTPASIATTFDGGPMMEKGEGGKALGAGIVFSFIGTMISIAALMFIAPWLAQVALSFGPHEYFAIAVFSLTLIATLSSGSMAKGVFAGVLGFAFVTAGIPTAPFIIGFILGPMAETSFRRGLQLSRGDYTGFLTNPISGAFLALAALSIAWQLWTEFRPRQGANLLKAGAEE